MKLSQRIRLARKRRRRICWSCDIEVYSLGLPKRRVAWSTFSFHGIRRFDVSLGMKAYFAGFGLPVPEGFEMPVTTMTRR